MSCEAIHNYIRQLLNHAVHKQHQFTDQDCLDHGQGGTLGVRQNKIQQQHYCAMY